MISQSLTIGTIIDSLGTIIFNNEATTELERNCIEREKGLKGGIRACMDQITELGMSPGLDKLTQRQKVKSENCVENLSKYLQELIDELNAERIIKYCERLVSSKSGFNLSFNSPFDLDYSFLLSNSFHTAITTEILWAPQVTVKQAIEISKGLLDLDDLGKHLPSLIKEIKEETLPYLEHSNLYSSHYEGVKEAVNCYKNRLYRGCNLILLITIEGMVRKLASFLSGPHDLGSDFSEEKYSSLSSLLRGVRWKKDFKIDSTTLSLLTGMNKTTSERMGEYKRGVNNHELIDLNTRLDFLKGRFKDDRDLILHGTNQEYYKKWNLFLNFSALTETQRVCAYYDELYNN